jgi:pilus assembly protein CpaD
MSSAMTTRFLFLTSLAPALLIGGCMGTQNRGLESVHQPVVSRSDYALDLASGGNGLSEGEATRLHGWLASMRLGYGDRVAIDDPAGSGAGVRDDIAAVVASYGLLLGEDTPVTGALVTPGTVRVVVSRMHAAVPGCPDWSRNASVEYDQNTSSNHGCAVNSNLAAMIASPGDLVRGQASDGNDPATSGRAIQAYRKASPSGAGGTTVASAGGK